MSRQSKKRRKPTNHANSDVLTVALNHHQAGRGAEADSAYQRLVKVQPNNPDAWHLWGVLAAEQHQYANAVERIQHALELKPREPVFLGNLGNAFLQQGQRGRAIESYVRALQQREDADLHQRLAIVCEQQLDLGIEHQKAGRPGDAEICYQDVLRGQPKRADAWHLLGTIALAQDQFEMAEQYISHAIELVPDVANFHNSLGAVYQKQCHYGKAIACCEHALKLQPELANAHTNLSQIYLGLRLYAEAERACRKVLALQAGDADAYVNLANVLKEAGRLKEAEAAYCNALALQPLLSDAKSGLGYVLYQLKRYGEALAHFEQVRASNSQYPYAVGMIVNCSAQICQWESNTRLRQDLLDGVLEGQKCVRPFVFLNACDDPRAQRSCAVLHAGSIRSTRLGPIRKAVLPVHDKIRVAYVSPDFGEHPVAYLIADLIEQHDRARFDVFGVSIGPVSNDPWRQRLTRGFNQFLDVRGESDEATVQRLRDLEIDIAVDLAGYTASSRPGIFAGRAAPIQVNYLGFPGTMGAEFMDYILADRWVIPETEESYYTEKVVCLPDTFQCASRREIAERTPSRRELGLPEAGFVFCCFNNTYKIHPPMFDIWMRLLAQVEGSVLWLFKGNEAVEGNLRREAQARGVSSDRLVFAPRVPLAQYLAQYRQADLFLDTLPYNAGTTASDALWAGLPVLTCAGQSFVSRMAGSLLRAVGLPELVTDNVADYEALALRLATHPDELAEVKHKLAVNRATHPLFDVDRFRRHIEAAYQRMWDIHQRGELPTAFAVATLEAGQNTVQGMVETGATIPVAAVSAGIQLSVRASTIPVRPKKLLHVGCGPANPQRVPPFFRTPEWQEVRLDINPDCQPDIVASMTAMSPVEDGGVDAIFSSHNLEHLYPHEVPVALKEFQRVLAPDGFAFVTLPDLQSVAELVAQEKLEDTAYVSPAGPIAPLDMLYGHRPSLAHGNLFMAHRTGFTAKTLAHACLRAGFAQVTVCRDGRFGLWAIACRQMQSNEQLATLQQALFPTR